MRKKRHEDDDKLMENKLGKIGKCFPTLAQCNGFSTKMTDDDRTSRLIGTRTKKPHLSSPTKHRLK